MKPKISFGIIVLNGEPFTQYCVRALYPHAHQIIIAEGACPGAVGIASEDGHSNDGTLETIREMKENEDPENKIVLVTAEDHGHPDGFWPGEKLEQCQAFAAKATGDYLWQVDIDEFYLEKDIITIKEMLNTDESISCISFKQIGFWGGYDYFVDSWYFKRHLTEIYRIFKWGQGCQYTSHRPPTVLDAKGRNQKNIHFLSAKQLKKQGIFMYHYSFLFPKQVQEKALYYKNAEWSKRKEAEWWANDVFMELKSPYRVFSISWVPSWLNRFRGEHPSAAIQMRDDILQGKMDVELRNTEDIEKLLHSPGYIFGKAWLKVYEPFERILLSIYLKFKRIIRKITGS